MGGSVTLVTSGEQVSVQSGTSATGVSGSIVFSTGTSGNSAAGNIDLIVGDSVNGNV